MDYRKEAKELGINSFGRTKEDVLADIAERKAGIPPTKTDTDLGEVKAPVTVKSEESTESEVERRTREIREMRERGGHEIGTKPLNLNVRKKDDGYNYHWALDTGGRISGLKEKGYEVAPNEPPRSAGKNSDEKHILMRIPQAIYDEDRQAMENSRKEIEKDLLRAKTPSGDNIEEDKIYGEAKIGRT